ncbi:uncharacterized protein Pelo_12746 [Pelomyxa schiedti]|nr:uncharacterized protein Pelo_12746 [Pelomyxa schiedti]
MKRFCVLIAALLVVCGISLSAATVSDADDDLFCGDEYCSGAEVNTPGPMVLVDHPDHDAIVRKGIKQWPTWKSAPNVFDWEYTETEWCYFLRGQVEVLCRSGDQHDDGVKVSIRPGDFVTFQAGLKCTWTVLQEVEKHYKFDE